MIYNREKAVAYARKWAYGRNPAYFDFSELGGDCTNFISQCLYAGSGVMNYTKGKGWYYISSGRRAPAWTGVEFLYRFLVTNKGRGPYASELDLTYARIGDIIQLSFNGVVFGHSLLVVQTVPNILIATHTDDWYGRPLNTYQYARSRLLHIEGVRA